MVLNREGLWVMETVKWQFICDLLSLFLCVVVVWTRRATQSWTNSDTIAWGRRVMVSNATGSSALQSTCMNAVRSVSVIRATLRDTS